MLCSLFTGCAASNSKYYLVKQHDPRKSSLGFSITPPPGDNWYETLKNKTLSYLKISRATAHSYSIQTRATEVTLERKISDSADLVRYVSAAKDADASNRHIKLIRTDYHVDQALSNCVRYEQLYEDYNMEGLGNDRHVNVSTSGLFCRHPQNRRVAIDVSYLEKSVSGKQTPSFRNEGEEFLSSLSFNTTTRL